MTKYVFTIVTKKKLKLDEDETMKLFDVLEDTDKVTTSAIREITNDEWDKMFEVLNK